MRDFLPVKSVSCDIRAPNYSLWHDYVYIPTILSPEMSFSEQWTNQIIQMKYFEHGWTYNEDRDGRMCGNERESYICEIYAIRETIEIIIEITDDDEENDEDDGDYEMVELEVNYPRDRCDTAMSYKTLEM